MGNFRKPQKNKAGLPRSLQLDITPEIIDNAVRADSTSCLLSDALKIAVPGGVRASTDLQTISISVPSKGLRYHWLTPRSAQALLLKFDQGAEISPTTVRLSTGWTTPIERRHGPATRETRKQRLRELEEREASGLLTTHEAHYLKTMRESDARNAEEAKAAADRGARSGRPPAGTLRSRKYGLRLTKLTQHGDSLLADQQ